MTEALDERHRRDLHDRLVPVAARYLRQLRAMLEHAGGRLYPGDEALLEERLRPDMMPLAMQVRIAMEFPFRALDQALTVAHMRKEIEGATWADLRRSIDERLAILDDIGPDDWRSVDGLLLRDRAGEAEIEVSAAEFVSLYVLPNFIFHLTVVYLTLRLHGLPLGKGDFDGFHLYPIAKPTG